MVYRRKGRPTYTFQALTETGYKQLGTLVADKALAVRIETMWQALATEHRAWDVLGHVLSGKCSILSLYDLWTATKYDIAAMRRRLADTDIEPLVAEYLAIFKRDVLPTTATYVEQHLRFLFPEGERRLASQMTDDALTARLYQYDGKPNMLRKVHSSWSGFFDYLVKPKRVYQVNPMGDVPRPDAVKPPIRFYELPVVQQLIDRQPTLERKALYALIYGTGLEAIVIVGRETPYAPALTPEMFSRASHEVRAVGTKTHTRDRIALVADWAWPTVEEYLRWIQPNAPLFDRDRSTLAHWHLETVRALNLPEYPLHCARHHWAVRQLRAGTPIGVVQRQLGHATAKETLDTYGPFIPSGVDRAKWERQATQDDERRRSIG